jgi:tetratricopeptide (TPR) repeat protein
MQFYKSLLLILKVMVQNPERIWDQRNENLENIQKFREAYDFTNALRICEIPDLIHPYTVHLFIQKIFLLSDFGYYDQARATYRAIAEALPQFLPSTEYVGILIAQRDLAEARRFLLDKQTKIENKEYFLGIIQYHEKDYNQAIKSLERGIAKLDASQKPALQAMLAHAYAKTGNMKKSSQLFEKINAQIKKRIGDMWIEDTMYCFFYYALIEMEFGNREKSLDTFKLILNTTKFLEFRLILECAKICKQMNETELTVKFIERLKKINPTHEEIRILETPG